MASWLITGCFWMVPFCLWMIGCAYYLYTVYFIYRRHKYGTNTTGYITKKLTAVSKTDANETIEYHLSFSFKDQRDELANKYLFQILNRFANHNYIPKDITQLCTKYVGDSFVFYYGPYTSRQQVTSLTFDRVAVGGNIQLKYDTKYPQNVEVYDDDEDCYLNYFFVLIMPIFCISIVCIGIVYGMKITTEYKNNVEWVGMIVIIFISSIVITSLVITVCCFKKRYFCFKRKQKLKFANDILDMNDDSNDMSLGDYSDNLDMENYISIMLTDDEETSDDETSDDETSDGDSII